jgi:maltose alpha-D-glucosyltransferase/alpha-amylase
MEAVEPFRPDGFRVDLAASLVKNDPDRRATIALWQELNAWFDRAYPNGVLIAEWFNPKESISAHFDVDFLRSTLFSARGRAASVAQDSLYFNRAGKSSVAEWVTYFGDQYQSTLNKGYLSLPTGNHDSPRIANGSRTDAQQLKVAMTFLLTQSGIPFIYYGSAPPVPVATFRDEQLLVRERLPVFRNGRAFR